MSESIWSGRRRCGLIAAASLAAVLALVLEPAIARAAPLRYVALGDSYSSGVGSGTYYADSGACRRSPAAYPALVAIQLAAWLRFVACSGATIGDVLDDQLGRLGAGTGLVTISIGGNDAGFVAVLTRCALPWPVGCAGRIKGARRYVRAALPGKLDAVFAAIRERAPAALVAVVGYPRLFSDVDCAARAFVSSREQANLNSTADLLDRVERRQARAHGFAFVDPRAAFAGHAVCDDSEWLNGLSLPPFESFHPNATGQASGYAPLILAALGAQRGP